METVLIYLESFEKLGEEANPKWDVEPIIDVKKIIKEFKA